MGESEAPAKKKKEKEKSTVMQSVTHITNPHPSLEHRPILTVQFSGFALMFISIYAITKPSVLQAPMPNSDTISNPKEKLVFTKGISLGIPTTL